MVDNQPDDSLPNIQDESETDGLASSDADAEDSFEPSPLFNRRSILKITGSAVAATGLAGIGAAETTRHGIAFDTTVNAVDDLGLDPTGNDPVDLNAHIRSNTLIEFPAGDYLIGNLGSTVGISNFGIRGLGASHRDVQFFPPEGVGQGVIAGGGYGPYLVENLSLNERDDETSALWFGLGSNRGGYMGDVEWLGRTPSDDAVGSDYQINASVFDSDATWVFENVRAGLDLPATPEVYPDGIAFLRSGPSHEGVAIMRDCVIHERNSTATRWEAGPGVVQMERCEFVNNQLCSIRVGGGNHPTENCIIKDCYVYGDGSRSTTAPIEMENDWPNPIILENTQVEWDTSQGLRGVVDSPSYEPCGQIEMYGCSVRNESSNADAVSFSTPPDVLDGTVLIENCNFTGSGRGIAVEDRPDSIMRDSCFDMPNGSISGIDTQNVSSSGCDTTSDSNSGPDASISVTDKNGLTVALTGSDSTDSDGQIAAYSWDVGGTTYTGSTVTHTFESGGTYTVSLTVEDDDGATASTNTDVTVEKPNEGPSPSISVPEEDGLTVALSGVDSTDSDGDLVAYHWDVAGKEYTGDAITHTFESPGTYTVSLTVEDDDGATATTTTDVSVTYPNVLTIEGAGVTTEYAFTVSDALATLDDTIEDWDDVDSTGATGWITYSGTVDKYAFAGQVTDFTFLEGDAIIYLDGEEVNPGYFGSAPAIDQLEVTEAGSRNPHANITVDWVVSDVDGNLSNVTVDVIDESTSVVASTSTDVNGSEAFDVDYFELKRVDGQSFDVRLTVTDSSGKQSSASRTVQE